MSDEDLNDNPVFAAFLASPLYTVAAQQQLIVAVPVRASLPTNKVSRDLLESHVLRQSPYYQDEYITVNNRSLSYNASTLVAKHCDRTVSILSQELYYDDDYQSFAVLRVSMPLDGKVPEQYQKSLLTAKSSDENRLERRPLAECEDCVARLTGDSPSQSGIFHSLNKFTSQFNTSYILVKGFTEHVGQKISDACVRLRDEALTRAKANSREARTPMLAELHWAIESLMMDGIHKKLFAGLIDMYRVEEETIQSTIKSLRAQSMKSLGVRAEVLCQPTNAINLMNELTLLSTPMMKLVQLEEVSRALTQAVKDSHSGGSGGGDTVLSAEDMIPLTLYCLIQSHLTSIMANYYYLQHFAPNKSVGSLDHLFVHFATFQAAVQMIQSGELSVGGGNESTSPTPSSSHQPRARGTKGASHQRALSTSASTHSLSNNLSSLHLGGSTIARVPSRSPTRTIDESESPSGWSHRPSVNRAASAPAVDLDDAGSGTSVTIRRLSSRASTHTSTSTDGTSSRGLRHATLPLPQRAAATVITTASTNPFASAAGISSPSPSPTASAASDDESDDLGEFLSSLKKANHVVTGSLRTVR